MESFQCGQIVKSKAGRDKDNYFVIVDVQDEYVYLVDGHIRRIENPKRKKIKHVQPTTTVIDVVKNKIIDADKITNAEIRSYINQFYNPDLSKEV